MKVWTAGSTRSGLGEWLVQRVSGLFLAVFPIYLIIQFSLCPINNYQDWLQWFSNGYFRLAAALFFLALISHSWVGMRSVYMDYLKPFWLRFVISLITALGLISMLLWLVQILIGVKSQ